MSFSKELLNDILAECGVAAEQASNEWLANAKPKYIVYNTDITGKSLGGPIDTMLDVCGFAKLLVKDKRSAFYKSLKKYGLIRNEYTASLPITYPLLVRQEMGLHESAMRAAQQVLVNRGLGDFVKFWSYID